MLSPKIGNFLTTIMKKFLCFPTWIVYLAMYRFLPEHHVWKLRKKFTLTEWTDGSTELLIYFGFVLWMLLYIVANLFNISFVEINK
jgi:hypothetical protein